MRSTDTAQTGEFDFESLRPRLEGIGYRMTGSVADAQDLVQEAWLRWTAADRASVAEPEAFVVRIVTRLALDRLKSAARRRETYVGPFLPEPVVHPMGQSPDPSSQPEDAALLADSLTYSFLLLLDELSPIERAVLLLHDVFGYPFDQVADTVDRSVPAVRQIASRTRRRVADARPGWDPDRSPSPATLTERTDIPPEVFIQFMVAVNTGDVDGVLALLAPDVVDISDGGAHQKAARRPVVGSDRVARFLINLAGRAVDMELVSEVVQVNGVLGLRMSRPDGHTYLVMTGEVDAEGRIDRIFMQLNPEKLTHT